eukprot:4367798-Pyramimonas_sp.AAC.1
MISSLTVSGGTPSLKIAPPCHVCFHHAPSSSEVSRSLAEPASVRGSAGAQAGRRTARQSTPMSLGTSSSPRLL